MSSDTIFFSYSREDSDFVLNLAKELRQSGADIWLDQLDIKPGSRWDRSIEKALISSQTLLVILSKSAVESTNVMDEVSFALEEKKNVVPVLLETCEIPFRLRRLQFADFTGDHAHGMETLIGSLDLNQSIISKLKDEEGVQKKIERPSSNKTLGKKYKEVKTVRKREIKEPKKKSRKAVYFVFTILIIAVAAAYGYWQFMQPSQDELDWNKIKTSVALEDYDLHLESFINCTHREAAIEKIYKFLEIEKDNADWARIQDSALFEDYDRHLEEFPNCAHQDQIKSGISSLTFLNKELSDWKMALKKNSKGAIKSFIKKYPSGVYHHEADSVLNSFKTDSTNVNIKDIKDWDIVRTRTTPNFFWQHIRRFPNCIHNALAKQNIKRIDADNRYWSHMKRSQNRKDFLTYLEKFGRQAVNFRLAKRIMYSLASRDTLGYVFIGGVTSDKSYLSPKRNYSKYMGGYENELPKVGDLMIALNNNEIYTTPQPSAKTNESIKLNQVVLVLEVKFEDYVCWIKVAEIR